jgi:hypothetical protein
MLETSTMYGEGEDSVAEGTHAYAQRKVRDRTLLFDHRQAADTWDLAKRSDRMSALREAYGPASDWMNLDAICDSWDDPQVSEAEFRRYWLNQPVPTLVETGAVSPAAWSAQLDRDSVITGDISLALEVAQDRTWACIAAAGERSDGSLHAQVAENYPDTDWVVAKIVELAGSRGRVALSPASPAGSLREAIEAAGVEVIPITRAEYAQACGAFYDGVNQRRIFHIGQPELDAAVRGAITVSSGDAWVFDRKKPTIDISPLAAVTIAAWVASIEQPSVYEEREVRFL